jgi:hypothetical protein
MADAIRIPPWVARYTELRKTIFCMKTLLDRTDHCLHYKFKSPAPEFAYYLTFASVCPIMEEIPCIPAEDRCTDTEIVDCIGHLSNPASQSDHFAAFPMVHLFEIACVLRSEYLFMTVIPLLYGMSGLTELLYLCYYFMPFFGGARRLLHNLKHNFNYKLPVKNLKQLHKDTVFGAIVTDFGKHVISIWPAFKELYGKQKLCSCFDCRIPRTEYDLATTLIADIYIPHCCKKAYYRSHHGFCMKL